ncbi:MAG: hypothetical protein ACLUKO_04065 [Enterocloster bolteae]
MELLRTEHLCKVYGTENQCCPEGVSFSVEKGEFVAIIDSPDRESPPCST